MCLSTKSVLLVLAVSVAPLAASRSAAADDEDVVRFDFETNGLQGWRIVEGKFDYFRSDRATFHNHPKTPYNKQGKYYLSTVEQKPGMRSNDRMTGVVESPVFVLGGPEMTMLVGGGSAAGVYVALCTLDGREVLHARGRRTETMFRVTWKVPKLVGKKVFLRIVDRETQGWGHVTFDDFTAAGRIDADATARHFAGRKNVLHRPAPVPLPPTQGNVGALRLAIEDLIRTFGKRYPKGKLFLARLEAAVKASDTPSLAELQREALLANPLVSERLILFITRHRYRSHYHAIDMLFHTGEGNWDRKCKHDQLFTPGGAMKTLDVKTGKVTTMIETATGVVRDPDVHWDGKRIVFAMRPKREENYHIYEINVDGSGLKPLTSLPGVADFDPVYLPDESIVFASTRDPKYNMCSRDHASNLYRMNSDGSNIFRITRNTLFDNHPEVMPDGRILYARWEYVDRNFGDAHSIWTVNPDGTNQAIYWGNNTAVPGAIFNQHLLPGTHQVLGIFGPHHMVLEGAMVIVDRTKGLDGPAPVVKLWPERLHNRPTIDHVREGGPFACDHFARFHPIYQDPWPLSAKHFLVTKTPARGQMPGIWLVDVFGNEVPLHVERPGCYDAMPLGPRERPRTIPPRRTFDDSTSYVVLQNVYEGTHMRGVKPGAIKHLRIVESGPKKTWSGGSWGGQGYQAPGMNWHDFTNKVILGTVPVEADGSAYFEVPPERFIFFQALDADGMMVQSMRSGTVVQPGETQSCIGCHEDRLKAQDVRVSSGVLALKRPPSKLTGWYGPARQFSYMKEVQPVFDKHCLKCHDFGGKAAGKLILAPDRNPYFNASYIDLWIWRRGMIRCVGGGPAPIQQAYSWGSHPSKLSKVLRDPPKQHKDLKLSEEDLARINTWLDLNGPYWPGYTCAYPDSQSGRSPIPVGTMKRLCRLTRLNYGALRSHGRGDRAQIAFERPELSPCLGRIKDKTSAAYAEALEIIRAGAKQLKARPRSDMPGYVPCAEHQDRLTWYQTMEAVERAYRKAIREGRKLTDRDVAGLGKDARR